MGIVFADGDTARLPAVQAFFARAYSPRYRLAVDETLLRWQFGRAAARDRYCLKLALDGDTIVACLGYIPVTLTIGERTVAGAWTANWMVDPAQRRLGLGPWLLRELLREFDVVLSVGLAPDAQAILPRMGFMDFGDLRRYIAVLDIEQAASLAADGTLAWPVPPPGVPAPRTSGRRIDDVPDDAIELWRRMIGGRGAGTSRSAEFLHWRYAAHPSFTYRLIELRCADRLDGLAVYRIESVRDADVRVGRIVELLAVPDAAPALIRGVIADATGDAALLDFFCASRRFEPALTEGGFVAGDAGAAAGIPMLFQPIDRRPAAIRFMAHPGRVAGAVALDWYVTKGDGDQDRPN
jgi:hypothetical protein